MGSLTLDGRPDVDTGHTLLRHSDLSLALTPRTQIVTWDQMAEPKVEPDTTFIFNSDKEILIPQGTPGGFIAAGGWTNGTDVAWTAPAATRAAGAFRDGVQVTKTSSGWIWQPADGLLDPTSCHVEGAFTGSVDWSAFGATRSPLFLGSTGNDIQLTVSSGASPVVSLIYTHTQDPTVTSRTYTLTSPIIHVGDHPASTPVRVGFSVTPAGTITLYVNNAQVAQQTGCSLMRGPLSTAPPGGGISIGDQQIIVSDLKFSRTPRVPGVPVTVTNADVLSANPASLTGKTLNKKLAGTVHRLKGEPAAVVTNGSPSNPAVNVIRTDKMTTATPIKAGAPDATHPTLGASGLYSYDWNWVDRTVKHVANEMGCELYLGFGGCPALLGGGIPPFSFTSFVSSGVQVPDVSGVMNCTATVTATPATGFFSIPGGNVYKYTGRTALHFSGVTFFAGTPGASVPNGSTVNVGTQYCSNSTYATTVPNDNTAFGHMCVDLADRIINFNGVTPKYASLWNEPDGSDWSGTEAQYLTMYQVVMPMVKAAFPSLKLGGAEFLTGAGTYFQNFINFTTSNNLPHDFTPFHSYSGSLASTAAITASHTFYSNVAGRPTPPELAVSEGDFGFSFLRATTAMDLDYFYNDWSAAWLASALIEMQRVGVVRYFWFEEPTGAWSAPDDGSLFPLSGVPWSNWNVMKLWTMMAPNIVTSTFTDGLGGVPDPGLHAVVSNDGAGKTTAFIANIHFRKWAEPLTTPPQTVKVNVTGAADGTPVTCWMIDDERSNQYDAGVANAALSTITVPAIKNGATYVPMKARSVALVQVGP